MQMLYPVQTMSNTATTSSQATRNTDVANGPQTILGKLEAKISRKLQQRHGKIPFRSNSKTNQTFTSKGEQIEKLKSEI